MYTCSCPLLLHLIQLHFLTQIKKMYKFFRDRSAESSSSNTAPNWSSRRLGMWLSLKTRPKSFKCSLCDRSFASLQALGGHQNAHRKERNEMYRKYMADMEKIGQAAAATDRPALPLKASSPLQSSSARTNELAAAFDLRQFHVQARPRPVQTRASHLDEVRRSKRPAGTDAGNVKELNLFPNEGFNVNAGSFGDGEDENEGTSGTVDLNLRLSC